MREKYKFKVDYTPKQYIGIHLQWDYDKREVICSMEEYVAKALEELAWTYIPKSITAHQIQCHQRMDPKCNTLAPW